GGDKRRRSAEDAVLGREVRQATGQGFVGLRVEHDHSGDLVWVAGGKDPRVDAACRVTDHYIRAWDLCISEQSVKVGGNRCTVLRTRWGIAPALARAVVSADGCVLCDGRRDPASPVDRS